MGASGVYWIYQPSQDRCVYVGSSQDIASRLRHHKAALRNNRHENTRLQRTWNKYGEADLEFRIVETCDKSELLEREDFWANAMPVWPSCCQTLLATRPVHSDETRRKISESNRGKVHSAEWNLHLSKPRSEEVRRKCSEWQKGRKLTAEHRANISKGWNNAVVSDETRVKISTALKGREFSEEHRRKISQAKFGIQPSEETKKKMSEAHKRYWLKRKVDGGNNGN